MCGKGFMKNVMAHSVYLSYLQEETETMPTKEKTMASNFYTTIFVFFFVSIFTGCGARNPPPSDTGGDKPVMDNKQSIADTSTTSQNKKLSKQEIIQVQQRLSELGYKPGVADGKLGKVTNKAIKKFQRDNNLAETGKADKITINMLEQKSKEQSVQPSPQPQSAVTTSPQAENIDTLPASSRIPVTVTTKDQNQAPAETVSPMHSLIDLTRKTTEWEMNTADRVLDSMDAKNKVDP